VNIAKLRELLSRKKEVLRDVEACVRLVRTGFVERIEHRQDVLKIFRVLICIVERVEQGEVFGTQLFLKVVYPFG
jgi:hypothetical protein